MPQPLDHLAELVDVCGDELRHRVVEVRVLGLEDAVGERVVRADGAREQRGGIYLLEDGLLKAGLELRVAREAEHLRDAHELRLRNLSHVGEEILRDAARLVRHCMRFFH